MQEKLTLWRNESISHFQTRCRSCRRPSCRRILVCTPTLCLLVEVLTGMIAPLAEECNLIPLRLNGASTQVFSPWACSRP